MPFLMKILDKCMKIDLLPCSTISLAHVWGKSESEEPAIGNCKRGVLFSFI